MDNYRPKSAHRLAYESANGPIPNGLLVRHTCDNPPCCNPSHLILGTFAENSRDMVNRGRAARLFQIPSTKLTDAQALELAARRRAGEPSRALAAEYGVSRGYVNDLASGRANRAALREAGLTGTPTKEDQA